MANYEMPIVPLGSLGTILVIGVFAYAAVRHRLMDIDLLVMRAAATLLAGIFLVLPVVATGVWVYHHPLRFGEHVLVGCFALAALVSVWMFGRFRSYLEAHVERSLFPARRAKRDAIRQLSADLLNLCRREDVGPRFTQTLRQGFGLSGTALYRHTPEPDVFTLAAADGSLHAPEQLDCGALGATPGNENHVVVVPVRESNDRSRFEGVARSLGWEAYVPVTTNGTCLGLIVLGPKLSRAAIDDTDVALLTLVAAQLAVALKNLDYVQEIEQQKTQIEELHKRAQAENVVLRAEVRSYSEFKEIVGSSPALQRVLDVVAKTAPTTTTILILGETGTGKELIARAIHDLSPRRNGPLISVNCPAIPSDLAESELFGHERGAFTGAHEARPGKFEMAHGGTIFLDEVADLPLEVQVKLLRVLQEHETQRVGGRKTHKLNLRVVAATNRDLEQEVRAGNFRDDLYHRLATMPVRVPPLRERIEDIPILASFFLTQACTKHQKVIQGFAPEALGVLMRYNWPGNIRELQNVIERAVLLCGMERICVEHLSDLAAPPPPERFSRALDEEKRRRIEIALLQSSGNQAAAARLLGVSRSNLGRLMKRLGMRSASAAH